VHTVDSLGDKLSPFVRHLLRGENRFRMPDIGNDKFNDEQFFVVTKEAIYCPYILPAVEHEIAHAVEMKDKARWCLPDWGLTFKDFVRHVPMKPSRFFASMAREVRVRAIQMRMDHSHNNDVLSTTYNILNNEYAWGGYHTKRFLPYGRFRTYEDVQAWVNDLREKAYNAWSLERIDHEWMIRLAHMQNWMETKEAA